MLRHTVCGGESDHGADGVMLLGSALAESTACGLLWSEHAHPLFFLFFYFLVGGAAIDSWLCCVPYLVPVHVINVDVMAAGLNEATEHRRSEPPKASSLTMCADAPHYRTLIKPT